VSIGHGRKDLGGELLGKERRPFGLAARTDATGAATEREKVLALAGRAANACEDMPMWGDLFRSLDRDTAALRVQALSDYLKSLQKP
jgi:hypothetical protein